MLDVKKVLAKVIANSFLRSEISSGATVSELMALPTGAYSNGNRTSALPTLYGLLLVFKGGYYRLYIYASTDGKLRWSLANPSTTTFSWNLV